MVETLSPTTLLEALTLKKEYPNALLYAGGSDFMVANRSAVPLFINHIKELKSVNMDKDELVIGAGCTYFELLNHPLIPQLLKEVIVEIASPAIRNVATMTGNICNASPAGDTLPVLYAYNAMIVAESLGENGERMKREIPIEEFILGIRKINLKSNEIVTAVKITRKNFEGFTKVYFKKVGARKAEAISKASFVGMMKCEEGIIKDLRIAFGSVGITVLRKKEIEKSVIGRSRAELSNHMSEVIRAYDSCIKPIDDQRSTAEYRKTVCLNLLEAFLTE